MKTLTITTLAVIFFLNLSCVKESIQPEVKAVKDSVKAEVKTYTSKTDSVKVLPAPLQLSPKWSSWILGGGFASEENGKLRIIANDLMEGEFWLYLPNSIPIGSIGLKYSDTITISELSFTGSVIIRPGLIGNLHSTHSEEVWSHSNLVLGTNICTDIPIVKPTVGELSSYGIKFEVWQNHSSLSILIDNISFSLQ